MLIGWGVLGIEVVFLKPCDIPSDANGKPLTFTLTIYKRIYAKQGLKAKSVGFLKSGQSY